MDGSTEREELHRLVDRLTADQARQLLGAAEELLRPMPQLQPDHRPRLSFTAIGSSGLGNLAENADHYLAEGFGRD